MSLVSNTTREVRKSIIDDFVQTGQAPNVRELMVDLDLSRRDVLNAFEEIPAIDTFWVEEGTENIRILSPFSNIPTPYKVSVGGVQKWYAVCGVEALGIWAFFPGETVEIDTHCRDCGEAMMLKLRDGEILFQSDDEMVVHIGVPVSRWMEDLPFA